MIDFLIYFLITLIMPILPILVCGLIAELFERLFMKMTGNFGRGFYVATSIIGTPVHELGHAVMCLPFGHKIRKICLWNPKAQGGVLGYVDHAYNKKNIWHRLGCMFISAGPVIFGLLVVTLIMWISFPEALRDYYGTALSVDYSFEGFFEMIGEGVRIIPSAFADESRNVWVKAVGGILILCICTHITLSPADIKNSLGALPMYSLICLVLSLIMFFTLGDGFTDALTAWCFMGFGLYMVVFAGIFILLLLGLLFYIMGKIFKRK